MVYARAIFLASYLCAARQAALLLLRLSQALRLSGSQSVSQSRGDAVILPASLRARADVLTGLEHEFNWANPSTAARKNMQLLHQMLQAALGATNDS
jgi:hypothetical protein